MRGTWNASVQGRGKVHVWVTNLYAAALPHVWVVPCAWTLKCTFLVYSSVPNTESQTQVETPKRRRESLKWCSRWCRRKRRP